MKEFVVSRHSSDSRTGKSHRCAHFRVDNDGKLAWADGNAESLFGYNSSRLAGMSVRKLIATTEDDPLLPGHAEALSQGRKLTLTFRHRDGYFFTGNLSLGTIQGDSEPNARASITLFPDAPVEMQLLRQLESNALAGAWELTVHGASMLWSEGIFRILELQPGLEIDPEHALFYFQEGQARVRAALRRCIRKDRPFSLELPIMTAHQRHRWVRLTGQAQVLGDKVTKVSGALVDISAEREHAMKCRHWQRLLREFLAATDDLVVALDDQMQIIALNDAFIRQFEITFGISPKIGDAPTALLLPHYPSESRMHQRLWERAMDRESFCVEMPLSQQNSGSPVFEVHYHRLTDSQDNLIGAIQVARNMTSHPGTSDNLNYLSTHDPLTGLLNRREFLKRLKRAMVNSAERGGSHALLYLELDAFEALNRSYGPDACDRYLRELAMHLRASIRQRDAIARVGGDRFAVLFDNCSETEAPSVADNLRTSIDEFVFDWRSQELRVDANGGLVPLSRGTDSCPEELLALAADLCQGATVAGRARLCIYRDSGNTTAEKESRARLVLLKKAIAEGAIDLCFQSIRPIASATWGDHIEVLSRLRLDDSGAVWEPAEFIPLAERFDLASQLDRLIVAKTLTWLEQNPAMAPRLKMCSFNLSLASVLEPNSTSMLGTLLKESLFSPQVFCFEIQESDAARYPDAAEELCHALHDVNCKVALDGVRGNAQSYTLISRLPIDVVKLDARLMQALAADATQWVMVEALYKVATISGKITIAQYIEDDEMLKKARELGIHFGQGFRLASPKPLAELAPPRWPCPGE